jgi:GNAT superfamily N-acetyltransferase
MEIEIRVPKIEVEWEQYYDLRYRILRQPWNQPRGSERNEGDETGMHFALYEIEILKAIARLDINDEKSAQVRFMAVETEIQRKGYGKQVMLAIENYCKSISVSEIVLHARDQEFDVLHICDLTFRVSVIVQLYNWPAQT